MPKHILILGGSSFVGKSLLTKLSQIQDKYDLDIHYINRNKNHWNYEVKKLKNINFTYGDRNKPIDFSKLLNYISNKLNITPKNKVTIFL